MKTIEMEELNLTKLMRIAPEAVELRMNGLQLELLRRACKEANFGTSIVSGLNNAPPTFNSVPIVIKHDDDETVRSITIVLDDFVAPIEYPFALHKQTIVHDPANGKYGDCTRTVIACILNKSTVEEVPNFNEGLRSQNQEDGIIFERRIADYLKTEGYGVFKIIYQSPLPEVLHALKVMSPDIAIILDGGTAKDTDHSVIVYNGEVAHNPNDHDIVRPLIGTNMFQVSVLVPLEYGPLAFLAT